jgi:hypothetical protein
MNPNENAVSAQTGLPTPHQQGDSMHWKRFLIITLIAMLTANLTTLLVVFMVSHGTAGHLHFVTQLLIVNVIFAIPLTLYSAGIEKLKSGGCVKVSRILSVIFTISFIFLLSPIFITNDPHQKVADLKIVYAYHFIPLLLIGMSAFPLSLYLTRKKKKPTPQPTADDAS